MKHTIDTTPIAASTPLANATRQLIEVWGDMASSWGISRTMAQVFALLYASPQPLDTDQIMEMLDISRGNANMNLHKLVDWGLIYKLGKEEHPASRKDLYQAEKDAWNITLRIIKERNEKEIVPVVGELQQIVETLDNEGGTPAEQADEKLFRDNVAAMADFMALFARVTGQMLPLLEEKNLERIDSLLRFLKHPNGHKKK